MESTVVDIYIPPPSFKLVSLALSRISSILKHPNKSFLTQSIYLTLLHTLLLIIIYFFRLTSTFIFLQAMR